MALPMASRSISQCALVLVTGASSALAIVLAPGVAHAQGVYYQPYPPPPPPPPPPPQYGYYRREYREEPEPFSALAIGVDVEGAFPVNAPQIGNGYNVNGGEGVKFRIGEQFRLSPRFRITPEAGYGYDHMFASDNQGDSYSWNESRVFGGLRMAFGRFFVPSLYAHVGYGWQSTGDPGVPSASGIAFDFGGALDIRILRQLQIGAHVEWVTISAEPYAIDWTALGLHIDLAL